MKKLIRIIHAAAQRRRIVDNALQTLLATAVTAEASVALRAHITDTVHAQWHGEIKMLRGHLRYIQMTRFSRT